MTKQISEEEKEKIKEAWRVLFSDPVKIRVNVTGNGLVAIYGGKRDENGKYEPVFCLPFEQGGGEDLCCDWGYFFADEEEHQDEDMKFFKEDEEGNLPGTDVFDTYIY